ncbi:MAG: hypothetical protein KBD56_01510 [Candidatus Eisenbacteria bacterium]|nr:hypothetical protein [Candidatus Eisenbacteria bacterium]
MDRLIPGQRAQIEQLIYGSFADKPGGYQIRFATEGVTDPIAAAVIQRCDNWGEIRNSRFRNALMTVEIPRSSSGNRDSFTMVDMVTNLGTDAAGRAGAQMHHVLVLTAPEHQALAYDPFLLIDIGALRTAWDGRPIEGPAEISIPDADARHAEVLASLSGSHLRAAFRIASRIMDGKKCIFWNEEDSQRMRLVMRATWILLPLPQRPSLRMATFAFLNRNDFDLASVYSDLAAMESDEMVFASEADDQKSSTSGKTRQYLLRIARALNDEDYEEAVRMSRNAVHDGTGGER